MGGHHPHGADAVRLPPAPCGPQQGGAVIVPAGRLVDREVVDEPLCVATLADEEAVIGAQGDEAGRDDLAAEEARVQAGDARPRPGVTGEYPEYT